jgi:hypothetical protein
LLETGKNLISSHNIGLILFSFSKGEGRLFIIVEEIEFFILKCKLILNKKTCSLLQRRRAGDEALYH